MKKRKITIDIISQEAKERGYDLLSTEYYGNEALLEFYCHVDNHGSFFLSYHKFHGGRGCQKCGKEAQKKKLRLAYEYVKNFIESQNHKLLDDVYTNSQTKLLIKCPNPSHEPFRMTFSSFQSGERCPECAGVKKHTIEEVKKHANSQDYIVLSDTYINNKTPLEYMCPGGHVFSMKFNDFQQGHRCPICKGNECSQRQLYIHDDVKSFIESYGYKLSSKYTRSNQYLDLICPNGHQIKMKWNDFQQGHRCDKCVRISLRGENSPSWGGGTTNLYRALRYCINGWKIKQFNSVGSICELSGKKSSRSVTLNVHHIVVSFSQIVSMAFENLNLPIKQTLGDYSTDDIIRIENEIKDLNEKLACGVVMEKEIHLAFHNFCGGTSKETSFAQLKEFCDQNCYNYPDRYLDKLL